MSNIWTIGDTDSFAKVVLCLYMTIIISPYFVGWSHIFLVDPPFFWAQSFYRAHLPLYDASSPN